MSTKPRLSILYTDAGGLLYERDNDRARDEVNRYLMGTFDMKAAPLSTYRQATNFLRDELISAKITHRQWGEAFLRGLGLSPSAEEVDAYVEFFVENKGHFLQPTTGCVEAMAYLHGRGVPVWIITDTMHPASVKLGWLARMGVARYITEIFSSADLGLSKNDPRIFKEVSDRSGVALGESCFVGHSPHEIRSSKEFGLLTISLEKGLGEDHYIPTLRELPALLERVFLVPEAAGA
ncbi:MAG: HAD hydrolase-like protein [Myxococcales bacterium]|nr:HAD hydrolase-like protein [Myxococcales bacterium]